VSTGADGLITDIVRGKAGGITGVL
jgi:hypothetical protein